MLHLAIIGIVCAVSALNEGIGKNYENNTFCLSNEGEQTITEVIFPYVYNVDVNNSSDCAEQKITNRTSSFFYDHIIKQYQRKKNYCSIMENVSLEKKENIHSIPVHRKRNLLWCNHTSNIIKEYKYIEKKKPQIKNDEIKLLMYKSAKRKSKRPTVKKPSGLNQEEKRLFLRLKNLKANNLGHLYFFEMNDLNLKQRIKVLSKKLEPETETGQKNTGKFIILENIKKLLSFKKDNNNHPFDSDSALCSVNKVRYKNPVTEKTASPGVYDNTKTIKKINHDSEYKNNPQALYSNDINLGPILKKKLVAKPYPYSARFKAENNFLYPKNQNNIYKIKGKEYNKLTSALLIPQDKLNNWQFLNNFHHPYSKLSNKKQKRYEKPSFISDTSSADPKIFKNSFSVDSTTAGISEEIRHFTESPMVLNPTEKYEESFLPDHTIEKPFLKRDLNNEVSQRQNFETHEVDWDPVIDSPFFSPTHNFYQPNIHGFYNDDILTYYLLKIRQAFRRYLNQNNLWKSVKRKKRSPKKVCSVPRKCWRSAPLLCIPYIKKGQEEVLKYIMKVIQDMMGKPIPPKSDIFGKTKYKPCRKKMNDDNCDDEIEAEYLDCVTQTPPITKAPKPVPSAPQGRNSSHQPTTPKIAPTKPGSLVQLTNTSSVKNFKGPVFSHINDMRDHSGKEYINKLSEIENQIPEQPFLITTPNPTISMPIDSPCPSNSPTTQKTAASVSSSPPTSNSPVSSNPTPTVTPTVEVTQTTTSITSKAVSASDSVENSCTVLNTDRPVGQEEYYSFTPKPLAHGAHRNMKPPKFSRVNIPTILNQGNQGKNFNKKTSHLTDFNEYYENLKSILPNFQDSQNQSFLTNYLPFDTTQPQDQYQTQGEDEQNVLKMPEEPFPDYFWKSNNFIKNKNSPEYKLNNYYNKKKGFYYNDYFLNDDDVDVQNQIMNLGIPSKKKCKKKHQKKVTKKNFKLQSMEPSFDYYSLEEHPLRKSHKKNSRKYHRRKNRKKKIKELENEDSLLRQKREDDYDWPDFYDNYLDDSAYSDESAKKSLEISDKKIGENASDSLLVPPSYEMFNELVKAITESTTEGELNITTVKTTDSNATAATGVVDVKKISQKLENQTTVVQKSIKNGTSVSLNDNMTTSSPMAVTQAYVSSPSTELASKKSSNTKIKNSKKESSREDKEMKGSQDSAGEGQVPTTLKTAAIVKGPKKLLTKPSPKIYSKVFPDSFEFGGDVNETTTTSITTPAVTSKVFLESKTALLSSTLKPDTQLQLLAVCEGYLEIIKRIKALNQSFGEDIDAELARHCESVISQSFNNQVEKPKKAELNEIGMQTYTLSPTEENEKTSKGNQSVSQTNKKKNRENTELETEEKDSDDSEPDDENETHKENKVKKKKVKSKTGEQNLTKSESHKKNKKKSNKKKKKKSLKNHQKKEEADKEEISPKGVTDDQVKLIDLLKQRKRTLMSWLLSSKDKTEDMPETEYFDDEDFIPPDSEFSEYSGTIKPKRNDIIPGTTKQSLYKENDAIFPIYAKHYGYDKGGELREVEVLWRKVNEKTHEEKILKNLSVIAFLMTSTNSPKNYEEAKLGDNKRYEGEDMSENELKSDSNGGYAAEVNDDDDNTSETESPEENQTEKTVNNSTKKTTVNETSTKTSTTKPPKKNGTHTFISKPDPSSIVGSPPKKNKTKALNITRKVAKKFGAAKDLLQEYNIEFLNYAVYILPTMFTIIFIFCCFGCFLYILKTKRSFKRLKRKKKKAYSTDDTSETTDYSDDVSKKRKRKKKSKNTDKGNADLEKKMNKKFWNVLKRASKNKDNDEDGHVERKNFLRFLKGKKDRKGDKKYNKNYGDSGDERGYDSDQSGNKHKKDGHKTDDSEAVERRELISLLEELKKIELEHTGEKKEVKSVHVQYTSQLDENPFQRPEFSYPYEKNVFGLPKGYSFNSKKFPIEQRNPTMVKDYELYEDVNEMAELLPCECGNNFVKKKDCLRHCDFRLNQEGRCKRFFKIFRDSGVSQNPPFRNKDFRENENRSFILNKYRNINTDSGEELMGVTTKNAGTEVKSLSDSESPLRLSSAKNPGLREEMDNLKRGINKKKYVRLKDDGVLCRL